MCKVDDPVAQRIHRKNAYRMVLASFVAGLTGVPGKQVRYANPRNIEQVLSIALSVQEAETNKGLMKPSILDSTTQYGCYRGHLLGRADRTAILGAQLTRKRSITCVVSITRLHVASHQTRKIEMSKGCRYLL
jgi:hypothetical protein